MVRDWDDMTAHEKADWLRQEQARLYEQLNNGLWQIAERLARVEAAHNVRERRD